MYIYVYIYIYIYMSAHVCAVRPAQTEHYRSDSSWLAPWSMALPTLYIYIYTYAYVCVYIYVIYIYIYICVVFLHHL